MGIARCLFAFVVCAGLVSVAAGQPGASQPAAGPQVRLPFQQQQMQRQQLLPSRSRDSVAAPHARVFDAVQRGVAESSVGTFADHFASQVYLQLRGSDGAYYSATQAFYVLDAFLRSRKTLGCLFSTFGAAESNPYATGGATFVTRGVREDAQIYVALQQSGDHWVITHLSIY